MARRKLITKLFSEARAGDKLLSDWMRANYEELVLELGTQRVAWRTAIRVIAELGLVDAHGKPPSPDTIYRTWRRVRSDLVASRSLRQPRPTPLGPNEIAPGVRSLFGNAGDSSLSGDQPRMRLEIRPARVLAEPTTVATSVQTISASSPTSVAPTLPTDPTSQIQRVLDAIGAARTPMPKKVR